MYLIIGLFVSGVAFLLSLLQSDSLLLFCRAIFLNGLVMTPILNNFDVCFSSISYIWSGYYPKEGKESEIDHRYQCYTEKNVPDNKMENS